MEVVGFSYFRGKNLLKAQTKIVTSLCDQVINVYAKCRI